MSLVSHPTKTAGTSMADSTEVLAGCRGVVGVVITAEFPACQYLIPQGPGPHELCTNSNCESHAAFVI